MVKPAAFFDPKPGEEDPRMLISPSSERNRGPILAVLERVLPDTGLLVEIGAGSGQHAAYFAPRFPDLAWQPTEIDTSLHDSIAAWAKACGAANIRPPLALDVTADPWLITQEAGSGGPAVGGAATGKQQEAGSGGAAVGGAATGKQQAEAVFTANMIHIAPWACCEGLMAGAGRTIVTDGILAIYGPFKRHGRHTSDSNASFDDSLRGRDGAWGVRDLEAVIGEAEANGLDHAETVTMPANNLMVIFRRG